MIIIDEAHYLRTLKGKRTQSAIKCMSYAKKRVLLTATPFVNSMKEVYTLASVLQGRIVKGSEDIADILDNRVIFAPKVIDPDHFPSFSEENIMIPMSKRYSDYLLNELHDPRVYRNPIPFHNGIRRMVNAVPKDGNDSYLSLKTPFIIQKILSDTTKKNLIFSNWLQAGVTLIENELKKKGITYQIITGQTSLRDRELYVKEYNTNVVNTLIISQAGGEGLDLKGTENVFVIDPPWNPANLDQVIGRAIRYDSHSHLPVHKRHVSIYYLILSDPAPLQDGEKTMSGDILLYNIISDKREKQNEFFEILAEISI
jgi:SNF2 family DNA or RNA helicase